MQTNPPPRKTSRIWLILALIAGALVVLSVAGTVLASLVPSSKTPSTQAGKATATQAIPTDTPTLAVTPASTHYKIGETALVQGMWQIVVNSAKTSQGSQYIKPKSGMIFLVIDISAKNITNAQENINSSLFTFRDSTGQAYSESFFDSQQGIFGGNIEAGARMRGQLSYQIPTSKHAFTLGFVPDFANPILWIWDIRI